MGMRRLRSKGGREIEIELDGLSVPAFEGENLACALLAAGEDALVRSVKYHRPRGPFCMEGACSQCLVRVDGRPNQFACRTRVAPRMKVERQNVYPGGDFDAMEILDWIFPKGIDHHSLFAGVPVAEKVMSVVARQLAGLGALPLPIAASTLTLQTLQVDVAVVGAGAAGMAAASLLKSSGRNFVVLERDAGLGDKADVRFETAAFGFYSDAGGRFLAALRREGNALGLVKVYAPFFLFCMGGASSLLSFENNDLPGVFSGRALVRMAEQAGIAPKGPVVLLGEGGCIAEVEGRLSALGVQLSPPLRFEEGLPSQLKAHGRKGVQALSFERNGQSFRMACDAIGVCLPASPLFQLPAQAGAEVLFSPVHGCFCVSANEDGSTAAEGVFVAGEGRQPMTPGQAASEAERAARAIAARFS
jgi:sarcosine oxidase subunit alpha